MVIGKTGSFGGITYGLGYNNRLLPSSISATSTIGTALSLAYSYFPNGNVQTITNSRDSGRTTTYGYDSLNRINSGSSQATSGVDCWGQTVPSGGYDRFSNLLTINVSKCSAPSLSLGVNAKNEVTNSGFGYDASGDETGDGSSTFAWDAEGRMKSGAGVNYTFDASGERVQDSSPKLYWYGQNGNVLAETDTSGNAVNEYIFFDGTRIARRDASSNVYYYFGISPLGSASITTASGSICYDADFYPFGGELAFTNTCAQNYKFAGMERDSPSGLARTIFRQFSSNYGRWLSPDPYNGSYDLANPQSLNRYAYVFNNPTNYIDPLGLDGNHVVYSGGCYYFYSETSSSNYGANGNLVMNVSDELLWVDCPNASGSSGSGTVIAGVGGGGSGGGTSSNSVLSSQFFHQWWKDVKSCWIDTGLGTIADQLNPLSPSVSNAAQSAVDSAGAAALAGAASHSLERGLVVPLRSSIVRAGVGASEALGEASGWIMIANLYLGIGKAAKAEWQQCGPF